jgi:mono/diheme cytochrome c family protein
MQNADTYNRGGFIAFLFSMIFTFAFFIYIVAIHPGVDLKEVPEEGAAQGPAVAQGTAAPAQVDVSKIEKPWEPNEDMVAHGKAVFQQNCAICHGSEGHGDGPAGKSLVPPPRNLVKGEWKRGGTSIALFTTVTKGLEGTSMASFAHLPVQDRWSLVQFIRSITNNKGEDKPAELEKFAQGQK